VGESHADGRGGRAAHWEPFLGVNRRGGGPEEGHRSWGGAGGQWGKLLRPGKGRGRLVATGRRETAEDGIVPRDVEPEEGRAELLTRLGRRR
jgi:hypothetical protein